MISLPLFPSCVKTTPDRLWEASWLIALYQQAVSCLAGVCPECGFSCHRHGTYRRRTPFAGVDFCIQRVICTGCGRTHALIPCFLFPYARVLAQVTEAAIRGLCQEGQTIEQCADHCRVEPATVQRWWYRFRDRLDELLVWLARQLSATTHPASWLGGSEATSRSRGRKALALLDLYRRLRHPAFSLADFDLLSTLHPWLFAPLSR